MKPGILLIMLMSFTPSLTSTGCKKTIDATKNSEEIISVSLKKPDTLYTYSFGYFGDEEGISIVKQASHSVISKIEKKQWEERIFQYQPQNNYMGRDTVIIETQRGSDGAEKNSLIDKTIFIFDIKY
jgi:hypothetical protein